MIKTVIIIGNGIAALSAAEKIRERDQTAKILLFAKESYPTYNRLELSKRITQEYAPEQIFIKPQTWYAEQRIELYLGQTIVEIDLKKQFVKDENGEKYTFSHLLLANGGSNFVPPIPGIRLENVLSLRTLTDAQQIRTLAQKAKKLLLIGGGLLGLEMAWQFKQAGLEITVVEMFPQLMPRQLDPETSRYLEGVLSEHGVELILGASVESLEGNKVVSGYRLKGGEKIYPIDFALYSTGMRPNIDLYDNTGLKLNQGVVVDASMRTNWPQVYAAGDVAELNERVYGLWSAARGQGSVAGENITDGEALFVAKNPLTNINVFGQTITSFGEIRPDSFVTFEEQNGEKLVMKKLFFNEDKLCGAIFVNDQQDLLKIRKLFDQGVEVPKQFRTSYATVVDYVSNHS